MSGNGDGDKRICGFCEFCHPWIVNEVVNPQIGVCRRYPPQVVITTKKAAVTDQTGKSKSFQAVEPMHPFVNFIAGACGEFKIAEDRINEDKVIPIKP